MPEVGYLLAHGGFLVPSDWPCWDLADHLCDSFTCRGVKWGSETADTISCGYCPPDGSHDIRMRQ